MCVRACVSAFSCSSVCVCACVRARMCVCVGAGMERNSAGLTEFDTPALIDLAEKPKQMNCGKKMVYIVDTILSMLPILAGFG